MSGRKRTKLQREEDLIGMAEMIGRESTQKEIGEKFGLSQPQVSKDLAEIRRRWTTTDTDTLLEVRANHILKLKWMKRQYTEAWEYSRKAKEVESQEKTSEEGGVNAAGEAVPGREKVKAALRREGQAGDPRFLDGLLKCMERESKMFGLDAAERHKHEHEVKPIQIIQVLSATRSRNERTGEIIEHADAPIDVETGLPASSPKEEPATATASEPSAAASEPTSARDQEATKDIKQITICLIPPEKKAGDQP